MRSLGHCKQCERVLDISPNSQLCDACAIKNVVENIHTQHDKQKR
jgi:hypothetical protein